LMIQKTSVTSGTLLAVRSTALAIGPPLTSVATDISRGIPAGGANVVLRAAN
jgi:hypothetical protein